MTKEERAYVATWFAKSYMIKSDTYIYYCQRCRRDTHHPLQHCCRIADA